MPSLETVITLLHQYGYLFLFVIAIIEGPIITIIGAFLAAQGFFNVFLVYVVVATGDLAGDLIYYAAGRFGRIGVIEKWLAWTGATPESFKRLEAYFKENGAKAMFYAKYTQTGIVALPAAGAARMPVGSFFWYNFLGTVPKSLVFVLIGYFFGYAYNQINSYLDRAFLVIFVIALAAGWYLFTRQAKRLEI